MRPRTVRAFSLVELIVVISIIALLLSLTGIGFIGWINSAKAKGTMTTMNTLKTAIDIFVNERPMASGRGDPRSSARDHPDRSEWRLPPPYDGLGYEAYFGSLPPSPSARIDLDDPLAGVLDEDDPAESRMVSIQFSYMVRAYLQGNNVQAVGRSGAPPHKSVWQSPSQDPPTEDHASIECLVLFVSRMSPRAKNVIDQMPATCKQNLDYDWAVISGNEDDAVHLIEITDAWDKPLRWAVQRVSRDLVRWELRSAGKDGKFSAAFDSEPDKSDDVVLQGP